MFRVGVEIGGTFTDIILISNGDIVKTIKVPSTRAQPGVGALNALRALEKSLSEIDVVAHGSTVATNAILERKGANTGLVTSKGFRDILEMQRENRLTNYDFFYQKSKPLVSRDKVREVPERIDVLGNVIEPLDENAVRAAVRFLVEEKGCVSLAISFLHCYKYPHHERRVKEIAMEIKPDLYLTLASDILPEFREYERTSTAVMSACVRPQVDRYITHIEQEMQALGFHGDFHIMQSNGGSLPAHVAREHGVRTLLSGPAAGVIAAANIARITGKGNLISLDMGGTSTDVCLINDGQPQISTDCQIDDLPLKVPMIDIVSVGAGGGSIAWMDAGIMLRVGPQSAGAEPGPACYGRGGNLPTVTDANVIRGLIRADNFLGGHMKLDPTAASEVFVELAAELKLDSQRAAEAVFKVANAEMANAIRLVSIERGYDPRDYSMVAFGGAGPLHACYLADDLDIREIIVPQYPGLFSAYGLLVADFKRDYSQTDISVLSKTSTEHIVEAFNVLDARALDEIGRYNLDLQECRHERCLDMRYKGQAFELTVPVCLDQLRSDGYEAIARAYNQLHLQRYGHSSPQEAVEIVNYRLVVISPNRGQPVAVAAVSSMEQVSAEGSVVLDGKPENCLYFSRATLPCDFTISGPAVVEEPTSTTFVAPGWQATVDSYGIIVMTREVSKQ